MTLHVHAIVHALAVFGALIAFETAFVLALLLADGAGRSTDAYDNAVTVEYLVRGRWIEVAMWEAT